MKPTVGYRRRPEATAALQPASACPNLWAGPQATPPAPEEAQLVEWTIELPTRASLESAVDSLKGHDHEVTSQVRAELGLTAMARDPWGTAVRLRAAAALSA